MDALLQLPHAPSQMVGHDVCAFLNRRTMSDCAGGCAAHGISLEKPTDDRRPLLLRSSALIVVVVGTSGRRQKSHLAAPARQMELFEAKKREVEAWIRRQPPQVEVAAATASGAAQGALIGGMMATFSAMEPPAGAAGAMAPPKARPSAAAWRLAADAFRHSRRGWWEDRPCLRATSR